jgi:hypothetical protein
MATKGRQPQPAKRTAREIARLVSVTMRLGSYHIGPGHREFVCPVAYEAKSTQDGVSHRFAVRVNVWEKPDRVPLVKLALAQHLADADTNGEPCQDAHRRKG